MNNSVGVPSAELPALDSTRSTSRLNVDGQDFIVRKHVKQCAVLYDADGGGVWFAGLIRLDVDGPLRGY